MFRQNCLLLVFCVLLWSPLSYAADGVAPAVPAVTVTPKPEEKVDLAKVNKALGATAGLNMAEKKKLAALIQRQLPKKSAAEKAEDRQMTIARWQAMSPDDKNERRNKAASKWATLSETEKQYQRDHVAERLHAMTPADRAAIFAIFNASPKANGEKP